MSCHDIGRGMNSVVKVVIALVDEGEIEGEPAKKIINACKMGVNWCDGNEHEAIACIIDCRCGYCLARIEGEECIVESEEISTYMEKTQNLFVTDLLCKRCFEEVKKFTSGDIIRYERS